MLEIKEFFPIWNEKHCEYIGLGGEERNRLMGIWCEHQLLEAKKAYYNGNPIMEDRVFDKIEEYLRVLNPDSKVLEKVGT